MMRYELDPDLDDEAESVDPDDDPVTFEDEHPDPPPEGDLEEEDEDVIVEDDDAVSDTDRAAAIGAQEAADPHPDAPSREVRWVPLGNLVLEYRHWKNPRTFTGLDAESLAALSSDIKRKTVNNEQDDVLAGIDDPLKVVRIAVDGHEVQLVLDGQRRHRAAQLTGLGDDILVPVLDREPDPVEWSQALARKYLKEVLTTVGLRANLSSFELSEAAQQLRGEKDLDTGKELTIAQIAAAIGRSDSWVSKILTARASAAPKLLRRWQNGELSEEQFRDLATGVADKQEQETEADKVTEQRRSGDKSGARVTAKERKEQTRAEAKTKRDAAKTARAAAKAERARMRAEKAEKKKAAKATKKQGSLAELPVSATPAPAATPAKPKAMLPAVVDDMLESAKKKPPTHELVKGILLGVQIATGRIDMADLPKPWHSYVHHLSGTKPPSKKRR
jgi:hypothetical protein